MREFHLTSELLLQAFWGGSMCRNNCLLHCRGYFNTDIGNYGRGFIEYCIAHIFNIHRLPGYEKYYVKDGTELSMRHEFGELEEKDIVAACKEIEELYYFVQNELKNSRYVKDGKIKLIRSLREFEIEAVTPQLRDVNRQRISMPVNIMTSYSYDGEPYGYGSSMSIIREIDVEKVIMFDKCLHHPKNACAHYIHGGEFEVWVVEDNMFGNIQLDRECFIYKELGEVGNSQFRRWSLRGEDTSLYTDARKIGRPCEWDKITKFIIKRNIKKIKQLYEID